MHKIGHSRDETSLRERYVCERPSRWNNDRFRSTDRVTEDFFPKPSRNPRLLLKMAARRDGDIRTHNGSATGEINSVQRARLSVIFYES